MNQHVIVFIVFVITIVLIVIFQPPIDLEEIKKHKSTEPNQDETEPHPATGKAKQGNA